MFIRILFGFVLCVFMTGCLGSGGPSSLPYQRGWIDLADTPVYRSCYSNQFIPLSHVPFALLRYRIMKGSGAAVYTEWIGPLNRDADSISVKDIRYLSSNPDSCSDSLSDVLLNIQGVGPHWNAQIDEDSIHVFLGDRRLRIRFPYAAPVIFGSVWQWQSSIDIANGVKHRMELTVEPATYCQINDDWFGHTADMTIDGRHYSGCVRRGMLDRALLSVHYSFPFYVSTRSFDLQLHPDGSALLKEDYQGIQPAVESIGSWVIMPGRRIMIQFTYNRDMLRQEVLVFRLSNEGALVMEEGHSRYGPLGIELVPLGDSMPLKQTWIRKVP